MSTKNWPHPRPGKPHYRLSSKEPTYGSRVVITGFPDEEVDGDTGTYLRPSKIGHFDCRIAREGSPFESTPFNNNEFLVLRD